MSGFEPLIVAYETTTLDLAMLHPQLLRGRDLNPRPLGYEPNELPTAPPHDAFPIGFEPMTPSLTARRSTQLSYENVFTF